MDVMTLGNLNIPGPYHHYPSYRQLGQTDPMAKAGTGMVAIFLVLGLGIGAWFLVNAAGDRYTQR